MDSSNYYYYIAGTAVVYYYTHRRAKVVAGLMSKLIHAVDDHAEIHSEFYTFLMYHGHGKHFNR